MGIGMDGLPDGSWGRKMPNVGGMYNPSHDTWGSSEHSGELPNETQGPTAFGTGRRWWFGEVASNQPLREEGTIPNSNTWLLIRRQGLPRHARTSGLLGWRKNRKKNDDGADRTLAESHYQTPGDSITRTPIRGTAYQALATSEERWDQSQIFGMGYHIVWGG